MIMQSTMQSIPAGFVSNLIFIAIMGCGSASIGVVSNAWAASASAIPPLPSKITDIAEPLSGTLFFSREQRERIDRARLRGEVIVDDDVVIAVSNQPAVINGFVKRSDGKNIVWVDGEMQRNVSQELTDELMPMSVGSSNQWLYVSAKPSPVFTQAKIISKSPVNKQRRSNKTKSLKPRLLSSAK